MELLEPTDMSTPSDMRARMAVAVQRKDGSCCAAETAPIAWCNLSRAHLSLHSKRHVLPRLTHHTSQKPPRQVELQSRSACAVLTLAQQTATILLGSAVLLGVQHGRAMSSTESVAICTVYSDVGANQSPTRTHEEQQSYVFLHLSLACTTPCQSLASDGSKRSHTNMLQSGALLTGNEHRVTDQEHFIHASRKNTGHLV